MKEENHTLSAIDQVVCPNCGEQHLEIAPNGMYMMNGLEMFSFVLSSIVSWRALCYVGSALLKFLGIMQPGNGALSTFFGILGLAAATCFSYCIVSYISSICDRHNGISVWYVRCTHCHTVYRIVRPFGAEVPWEMPEESVDEDMN